jgi:Cd2+/Zn2+-exporting ATPase
MKWTRDIQSVLTALCGLCLVLAFILPGQWAGYASVACGSYFALKAAWGAIEERTVDVNILMILAAVGSIVVGHITDAAALLFLFSLSSTLEAMAMGKTMSAIESLIKLKPETAIRITDSGDEEVKVSSVTVGDRLRVLPYELVPADGVLETATGSVDESAMTGESRPVEKASGDKLMAGTHNLDSMVVMRVSAAPGDTTLDKIVTLVQESQDNKASGERISEWFGQRYTFFVLGVFAVSMVVRLALGMAPGNALYASLILLVALSPCALVISTPAATLSALANAARRGILVRGGQYMEAAGMVSRIAMDKTGTITLGTPQVVEICATMDAREPALVGAHDGGHDPGIACWRSGQPMSEVTKRVLTFAAAAEKFSTHPIAEAIVAAANQNGTTIPEASSHTAVAGKGIIARVGDTEVQIGQVSFHEGGTHAIPADFHEHVLELQTRGLTAVLMRYGEQWACLGMQDVARKESTSTIGSFQKSLGLGVSLMTGDNLPTATAIAKEVGIGDIHAGLMPQDKLELVKNWESRGEKTMVVGDGINDAPALAGATIGVAMGGLGSEAAMRAADVVLVNDRIERIPELIHLGRRTNRTIRTNLLFASGMIVTLTVLSLVWAFVPALKSLAPAMPLPLAVVGHEGSTVLVILNGLRLLRRVPLPSSS